MKIRTVVMMLLVLSLSAWAKPDFVMTPEEQKVVTPKSVFDPDLTKTLLEPGTCTLKGKAFNRQKSGFLEKKKGKQIPAEGTKIYLFPYTDYCAEAVGLLKKYKVPEQEHSMETLQAEAQLRAVTGQGLPQILPATRVELETQFLKIWASTTICDGDGSFLFENLKPGKYYLQSQPFMVSRFYRYDVQVGEEITESYWSNGEVTQESAPIFESETSTMFRKIELSKVVTVRNDGDTVEVELNEEI